MKPNSLKLIAFAVYLLFFSASSSAQKTYSETDIEKKYDSYLEQLGVSYPTLKKEE